MIIGSPIRLSAARTVAFATVACAAPHVPDGPAAPPATWASARAGEFGFVHHETTGVTSAIWVDGREVAIQFDVSSNAVAKGALDTLDGRLLIANGDGTSIIVEGYLDSTTSWSPHDPDLPRAEAFHWFQLRGWHLRTPFRDPVWSDEIPETDHETPHLVRVRERADLRTTDFDPPLDAEFLPRFVMPRHP
jgi:hypothetical protein